MSHASFWDRLVRGTRWTWLAEPYRAALPADLEAHHLAHDCEAGAEHPRLLVAALGQLGEKAWRWRR